MEGIFGLARRSRALLVGTKACEEALEMKTAKLIIIAKDAGNSTRRNFYHLAKKNNVEIIDIYSKKNLGQLVGFREAAVLVVIDSNFCEVLREALKKSGGE